MSAGLCILVRHLQHNQQNTLEEKEVEVEKESKEEKMSRREKGERKRREKEVTEAEIKVHVT